MSSAVHRHDLYLRGQERHSGETPLAVIPGGKKKQPPKKSSRLKKGLLGFSLGLLGTLLFASYIAVAGFLVRRYEIPLPASVEHILSSLEGMSEKTLQAVPEYAFASSSETTGEQSPLWNCNGKYTDHPVASDVCIKVDVSQSEDDSGNRFYGQNWNSK
ncbi:MAG: hypothetical protein KDD64_13740 [Bdellovibrionales bacterium]|nr:hypothetical protein [Bdellovibrionales bacterium]